MVFSTEAYWARAKWAKVPQPIENHAKQCSRRVKEIRDFSNSLPAMAGVVWIEVKGEIDCLEKRLYQLGTTLKSLQSAIGDLRLKMADERALFETLSGFESLPPRGKEIVASSYFNLVATDLRRRMQNLAARVKQILSMRAPEGKTDPTSQAMLLRRVIVKNQEILSATAARMYNIHEQVLELEHHMVDNQHGPRNNAWAYSTFTSLLQSGTSGNTHFVYDSSSKSNAGPPPLEPITGLRLYSASGDRRLPLLGPRKETSYRIDNESLAYVGIPDPSGPHIIKVDTSKQRPIIPNYDLRSPLEPSEKAHAKSNKSEQ
ncbi:uncharacterized protein LOC111267063 isoform X2 [Varroa jacobsoni]|uniref:Uncharacterized protein n=1 Tax=Varroa destructor TaxID=109461 RepID=A0A7M7JUS5_VARDE|nr:uncharacterized protein LOC111246819 isoform X2 [Varroa destructor]XP_022700766.1 uncharacterized protein LOC111267063 isoform X2 [Varroa jacobsoni]